MAGSGLRIVLLSLAVSFFVFASSLVIQWLVYEDWLHQTGPLHITGSAIAALLTFAAVLRWQRAQEKRQAELLRRFEVIADMNDRIRNALQVIECTTFVAAPEAAHHVRQAVAVIDDALRGVVADAKPPDNPKQKGAAASTFGPRKSA